MKTALVTTTINVPQILLHYRKLDPDVEFFVTGDLRTPAKTLDFCDAIKKCHYYTPARQRELGYACSELLSWNTIGRRCIAILEAVKWGADHIITIDDDNIPISSTYFLQHTWPFVRDFTGMAVIGDRWFDVGQFLIPKAKHRGFPHWATSKTSFGAVIGQKIGVAAGLCLGDPDIDATTRLELYPEVQSFSEILRIGICVDSGVKTVFNTQNTSFLRQFAPCFLLAPSWGRYDDIFASLVCQTVMRAEGYAVHFGMPAVWQQRNDHNILRDLRNELSGMERFEGLAALLGQKLPPGETTIDKCRAVYRIATEGATRDLADAWLDDMEKVL